MNIEFRTQFDQRPRIRQNPGSPVRSVFQARYDDNGALDLVETGKEDLYSFIQSHRDSVDIHVIMKRCALGDVDALTRVQGFYGDVTDMPSTYAEVLNAVIAGEQMFNSLPVEIRARYGHNFASFMAAMDKPDFWDTFGKDVKPNEVSPQVAPGSSSEGRSDGPSSSTKLLKGDEENEQK